MTFSKFDQLIYYTKEAGLSTTEILRKVKELFPKFDEHSDTYNDRFLTPFILEEYSYARSVGMTVEDAAHSVRITATAFKELFEGVRLSLDKLVALAEAETYAAAEQKRSKLRTLEQADGVGAAVTFLEKVYNKEYAARQRIDIAAGFGEAPDTEENTWNLKVTHVKTMPKESSGQAKVRECKDAGNDTDG